jgi:hypothetical protein
VAPEFFGKRHEFAGAFATRGPVDESLILMELGDLAKPESAGFAGDGDDVGNVARTETAANG